MTDTLYHRGPDDEGFYIKNNIGLGHRRLSIIDLSTGNQPMYNDDQRIVIVFNGEIYNYIELKEELIRLGYNFSTSSDTEVIIKAYEEWGTDCQNKFNGMWAFAIWDDKQKQLFISRDRIGEKPLHYATFAGSFLFGSEIKSILAYGFPKNANLELLELYLSMGYIPDPFTFYKGIYKLRAGHYIIAKNGNFKEYEYWDLPVHQEDDMLNDKKIIYEQFEYLIQDSVKLRMRSDVPFGAFLSGGLDSASIVALMSEISDFPIETFTIGFQNKAFDERNLSRDVSRKFKTNHHEHVVTPGIFDKFLKKIIFQYDEPFGDSSAIPTGIVSKFAREKVKMVLTGDGGDEVLSGYTVYQGEKFAKQYQNIPDVVREYTPFILSFFSKFFRGKLRYQINRVTNVLESSNLSFEQRLISKGSWIDIKQMKNLLSEVNGLIKLEDFQSEILRKCNYRDGFYKIMYLHHKISLPGDYLAKVDRMSMAYSLETRIPFLDYRIIEFMAKINKNVKMEGYERKSVLRKTIGKRIPPSLLKAPKKGFSVPLREWFKSDYYEKYLMNLKQLNQIGLNKNVLNSIIRDNIEGRKDHGNFIWMLLVLNKWFDENNAFK